MVKIGMRGVAILLVLSVSGCATPGYSPVSRTADWLPPGAKVAVVVGRFNPTLALDAAVRGRGEGGATGVLEGMRACLEMGSGSELGALFSIVCMPFGAVVGAVAGAIRAAPEENVASAEQRIASASKSVDSHRLLLESVQRYARESGLSELAALPAEGPQSLEDAPRYRGGPDYVVEVVLTELRATTPGSAALPYHFRLSARGRLVRVADNEVVDTFTSTAATNAATVDEWTAENGKLFVEELGDALQHIGAAFVDEWILLYRGETAAGTDTKPNRTPDYMLRPLWPVRISLRVFKRPMIPGHLAPISVGTATPLLDWERLPSTVRAELFEGASPRARNIRYDVQVLDAGPFLLQVPGSIAARRVVRRYTDLTAPEVRVDVALTPCAHYFWTVRARFELDGRQRSTEWSGAYHSISGDIDPRWDRRTSWPALVERWPNRAFYFPFVISTADGKACD